MGLPPTTDLKQALLRAASVFVVNAGSSNEQLIRDLEQNGLSPAYATYLFELLPVIAGRHMFSAMGIRFADEYVRMDAQGQVRLRRKFKDDPLVQAFQALRLFFTAQKGDFWEALVLRSAEVNAINQALHAGSKPQDLVLSPPVLEWRDDVAELPQPPPGKPWWKFW